MSHVLISSPHHAAGLTSSARRHMPGLLLCGGLAAASLALGRIEWLQSHGLSALTLAIVLGMLVGNTVYPRIAASAGAGVGFSKQNLLRLGVVLYGLRLTVQDMAQVGVGGVLVDALVLLSTFGLAYWAGTRWLGMDRKAAMLIGAGSSICGAAAVMAAEPVVKARAEQVTVAVATVVAFGTLSIFLYPLLFQLNQHWPVIAGGEHGFGVFTGATVHEVAQVVAAARLIGPSAADTAVIAKMVRVTMLAPFLIGLSALLARSNGHTTGGAKPAPITVPWFAFGFIGVVLAHSVLPMPAPVLAVANEVDIVLLAMAMAALGLATHVGALRQAGLKPVALAGLLFFWLVAGGAAIHHAVFALIGA